MKKRLQAKPPKDSWDALGWLSYLHHWRDDWVNPGGLPYEDFHSRFMLAIVPGGWIKETYGPTAIGREKKDIGKGHAAFLSIVFADQRPRQRDILAKDFFQKSLTAIRENDGHFFPDFWQAVQSCRECESNDQPLLAARRQIEFMTLAVILEDGEAEYTVKDLRKLIQRRFGRGIEAKALDKAMVRLSIQKPNGAPS